MPNANYLKGRRNEYELMKALEERGYVVMRTSGSHGPFDVIGINPKNGHIQFIQAKVTEDDATAKRLLAAFKEDPPIPPFVLPPGVAQVMSVKVTRKGRRQVVV